MSWQLTQRRAGVSSSSHKAGSEPRGQGVGTGKHPSTFDTNLVGNEEPRSQKLRESEAACSPAHVGTASPCLASRSLLWGCKGGHRLFPQERVRWPQPLPAELPTSPERTLSPSGCLVTPPLCLLSDTFVISGQRPRAPRGLLMRPNRPHGALRSQPYPDLGRSLTSDL